MVTPKQQLRVYLVEDSPILLSRLIELLQGIGVTLVGHANSATVALAEITTLRPDAIIVDIALQSGNGFEVLRTFSGRKQDDCPTRIVLTNFTSAPYRNAAEQLGVEYFFDKSLEILEMVKAVASMTAGAHKRNGSDA